MHFVHVDISPLKCQAHFDTLKQKGASMVKSKVKEIMEKKGITYVALEEKTKLSSQTITRARGDMIKECRISTLETIAKALGVKVKDLFVEE